MNQLGNSYKGNPKLDPNLRDKLLKESNNPFRGIRRLVWIALFGSASIGLLIMSFRYSATSNVSIEDIGIQVSACFIFGLLLLIDREKIG